MARKARQRITYVLPLADSSGGHRLGVNGLAVDQERTLLYSGGRDGVICTWNFNPDPDVSSPPPTTPLGDHDAGEQKKRRQISRAWRGPVQAHTHWINDITLAQNNSALISASSDLTVKLWRPHADDQALPQTIGLHSDYVKCLATSKAQSDWVASGGLDHKVRLWDLNGGGQRLQIDVGEEEKTAKGSVYALAVGGGILASGGPESIVRLWDPRSGKRVTKLVGHTDNVRDILVSDSGDIVMTASSDQTVKIWSVSAGRCIYTLTMHNDSVWSLYSDHPQLSVFYSSDRSGLVAKTSVLGAAEMDDGLCVAVCQEQEGVKKVVGDGSNIWTATSNSSISRWADLGTNVDIQMVGPSRTHSNGTSVSGLRQNSSPQIRISPSEASSERTQIPVNCILRLSNTAQFPKSRSLETDSSTLHSMSHLRKGSESIINSDASATRPLHDLPEESIQGQNGLIKHILLNDRRRVLTLDTAGEVTMWDLVKCEPVHSYGKRHLQDVASEVNTMESIANWCAVDTRTGRLACVLEDNCCFDAEMYADELSISEVVNFREDQRINLGKWVLRYLFSALIDEEIRRDEAYRKTLSDFHRLDYPTAKRGDRPTSIQIPTSPFAGWPHSPIDMSGKTPRAVNGLSYGPLTPGMTIGAATPAIQPRQAIPMESQPTLPSLDGSGLEKRISQHSQSRSSSDKTNDYFSANPDAQSQRSSNEQANNLVGSSESQDDRPSQGSSEPERDNHGKESSSLFGKKFRNPFSGKKLGRSASASTNKPAVVDEKAEESDGSKSIASVEPAAQDNFYGVIQKMRQRYQELMQENPGQAVPSGICPSLPNETPVLKLPPLTTVIIQEDRPDSGGVADLYRGTVSSVGGDADLIEAVAPMWLGDLLLRNQMPYKETVKISFVLQPYQDLLPSVATADGNVRLNANRMLRVKKILAYVAERIEPQPKEPDPEALKPEEYLELYCQNQVLSNTITLSTLRAHIWKGGGDIMLYYKSNGKKVLGRKVSAHGEHIMQGGHPIPGSNNVEEQSM